MKWPAPSMISCRLPEGSTPGTEGAYDGIDGTIDATVHDQHRDPGAVCGRVSSSGKAGLVPTGQTPGR
jgi:hypothetical protein